MEKTIEKLRLKDYGIYAQYTNLLANLCYHKSEMDRLNKIRKQMEIEIKEIL